MDTILLNYAKLQVIPANFSCMALQNSLMFSDKTFSNCSLSFFMSQYNSVDTMRESRIASQYYIFSPNLTEKEKKESEALLAEERKLNTIKHKSRNDLIRLNILQNFKTRLREALKIRVKELLEANNAFELCQFQADENIIGMHNADMMDDGKNEAPMTSLIHLMFTQPDGMFLTFSNFNKEDKGENFSEYAIDAAMDRILPPFIYAPLFEFPQLDKLKYDQLKYTRENILRKLKDFNSALPALKTQLMKLEYNSENFSTISNLCNDFLSNYCEEIDSVTTDEIYIRQASMETPVNTKVSVHLAVASWDFLLRYFENTHSVEPYMINTIRQRMEIKDEANLTNIFYYLKVEGAEDLK